MILSYSRNSWKFDTREKFSVIGSQDDRLKLDTVHIRRERFTLDGVLVGVAELAAEIVVSSIGLCKLCRVRLRLSDFDDSAAGPDLLISLASTADGLAPRGGNGVAGTHRGRDYFNDHFPGKSGL